MVARSQGAAVVLAVVAAEIWVSLQSGGFFAGSTGIAAVAAGIAFVVWLMVSAEPFAGLSRPLAITLCAFALFAAWVLVSQLWSHAEARATIEFDRALLYALIVALAGLAATPERRRMLLWGIAAAITAVAAIGLATRLFPGVWLETQATQPGRLSYPVTYWNALALMSAFGIVACLHLASASREVVAVRALACAALPILVTTALLTFSRSAIALAAIGCVAYLALARQRTALSAVLAGGVPAAIAGFVAYSLPGVVGGPEDPEAVGDGRVLAFVLLGCVLAAPVALLTLRRTLEPRSGNLRLPRLSRRSIIAAAAVVVVAGIAAGAPAVASDAWRSFTRDDAVVGTNNDTRDRLTNFGNNGHLEHWRVGLKMFSHEPVRGTGAGTYAEGWVKYRRINLDVNDGHSLLLETLGELGLVGGALILVGLITLIVSGTRSLRRYGPERAANAALLVIFVLWAIHAQLDWDWEMPAVTAPALACGAALAGASLGRRTRRVWPNRVPRLVIAITLLAVLLTPLAIARSQRSLNAASAALRRGDCNQAVRQALASNDAFSGRPEPFQILAVCDLRLGRRQLALQVARAAVRRDRGDWQLRYSLAIVSAANGLDPRPALHIARSQNPRSLLVSQAIDTFFWSERRLWPRRALALPVPT